MTAQRGKNLRVIPIDRIARHACEAAQFRYRRALVRRVAITPLGQDFECAHEMCRSGGTAISVNYRHGVARPC